MLKDIFFAYADDHKDRHQKLSDKLLNPIETIACPLQRQDVKCMLQQFSADRIGDKQILKNTGDTAQSIGQF